MLHNGYVAVLDIVVARLIFGRFENVGPVEIYRIPNNTFAFRSAHFTCVDQLPFERAQALHLRLRWRIAHSLRESLRLVRR